MAKIKSSAPAAHDATKPVEFTGTSKDSVIKVLDKKIGEVLPLEEINRNDIAVIAEDKDGMYVTGLSYVGTGLLDPFKVYRRRVVTKVDEQFEF